jgi:hypothetical protein
MAGSYQQRDRVWQEFAQWAQQRLFKPPQFCNPTGLAVYLESHYLEQHGRQVLEDGSTRPAPSSVATTVAHLSTRFAELGRQDDWDPASGRGNPCRSLEVRTFKGGYANVMQDEGFSPRAVMPTQ